MPEREPPRSFVPAWGRLVPFLVMHLLLLLGYWAPPSPELLALCLGCYLLRMFGVTLGYHRYFAHRSFTTSRAFQLLLALWANLSAMRGPLVWVRAHRSHHRYSDGPEDLHSYARRGFFHSHVGWFLSREYEDRELLPCHDLEASPELVFVDRHYYLASYGFAAALALIGGFPWLFWGGLVSVILCWHATFAINSLAHVIGRQSYPTGDESRNSFGLALICLGEGWHNNHHYRPSSARQGFRWWQLDLTWLLIIALRCLGLIWDLRPALEQAEATPGGDDDAA